MLSRTKSLTSWSWLSSARMSFCMKHCIQKDHYKANYYLIPRTSLVNNYSGKVRSHDECSTTVGIHTMNLPPSLAVVKALSDLHLRLCNRWGFTLTHKCVTESVNVLPLLGALKTPCSKFGLYLNSTDANGMFQHSGRNLSISNSAEGTLYLLPDQVVREQV